MRTAEFVSPKHPDKMCDQISDAILDWVLERDPQGRVAAEVMGGHGQVFICGEITMDTHEKIPFDEIVHRITGDSQLTVIVNLTPQSPEIANGVDTGGAGDQGIMRGYAVSDTPSLMPVEYELARSLCMYLYERHPYDGKTQVTVDPRERAIASKWHGLPAPVTIVASFQNVEGDQLVRDVSAWLRENDFIPSPNNIMIHANPAGDWKQGGFDADTGLTGRKLAVDNYGPSYPIGGGAFSGKDASKVDRSAAYMARKIAVDYLRKYKGQMAAVEIAYAIGVAKPVEAVVRVDNVTHDLLLDENYDLTPNGIIKALKLRKPQYEETARWGHFGRGFGWDK